MIEGWEFRCTENHPAVLRESTSPSTCPRCGEWMELYAAVKAADQPMMGEFRIYYFRRLFDEKKKVWYNTDNG